MQENRNIKKMQKLINEIGWKKFLVLKKIKTTLP